LLRQKGKVANLGGFQASFGVEMNGGEDGFNVAVPVAEFTINQVFPLMDRGWEMKGGRNLVDGGEN
jgi:hypothetical protein